MEIKILGTGCVNCRKLERLTYQVVKEEGLKADISKVEDIVDIMKYGVMTTPALVVNEQVILKGRVPSSKELKTLLVK